MTKINIFRPILAILILFIPLYPKFPLMSVDNTYVAIRLDDIVVGLSILIWFLYQLKYSFPILRLRITWIIIAYLIAICTSAVTAIFIYQTEPTNILLLNLFRRFQYISLFFVTLEAIRTTADSRFALIFSIIASIFVSIYGLGQKYYQLPVISTMNEEFSKGQLLEMNFWTRISSTFAGHYDLAAFLSVFLVLLLGIATTRNRKIFLIAILPIWLTGFYILTLTASRISIFAFWGGSILVLLLLRRFIWIFPVSLLVITSIFSSKDLNQRLLATLPRLNISTPSSSTTPTPPPLLTPTSPTPSGPIVAVKTTPVPTVVRHGPIDEAIPADVDAGVARSGEIRFNVEWPRAINAYRKNPVTGTGLGSITLATDNDYLRLLGESGVFGLTTFAVIILYFLIETIKKRGQLNFIFAASVFTFLANAIFIDVFEASKTAYLFWIMMGIYYRHLQS